MLRTVGVGAFCLVMGLSQAQDERLPLESPKIVVGLNEPALPVRLDPAFKIGKIHQFLNDTSKTAEGVPSVDFEFKYVNFGAITKKQQRARMGNYYIINWSSEGAASDLTLRLDYRQSRTRETVKTLEIYYPNAQGHHKGKFEVIGDSYHIDGKVHSWRVSLIRNGEIIAQRKSFVW